jgi:hypothetical protein
MNTLETAGRGLALAAQLLTQAQRLLAVARRLGLLRPRPQFSYENLSVHIVVDLQDRAGQKAEVTCNQRVRFLVAEAGVISSHVWGEGQRVRRLSVAGARSLERRVEGSRELLLLGLQRRPGVLATATVKTKRSISGGFIRKDEYFEVSVERPTKVLSLKVLFPKIRPPRSAFLNLGKALKDRSVSPALGSDGRACLRWRLKSPELNRVYRLNWSW